MPKTTNNDMEFTNNRIGMFWVGLFSYIILSCSMIFYAGIKNEYLRLIPFAIALIVFQYKEYINNKLYKFFNKGVK